jgi:hypothetical protein
MPDRRKRITEKLSELHANIKEGDPIAAELDEPLRNALGQVEKAASSETDEEDHSTLADSLGDLALNLEVSHPKLTDLLNHISELLAGAGI